MSNEFNPDDLDLSYNPLNGDRNHYSEKLNKWVKDNQDELAYYDSIIKNQKDIDNPEPRILNDEVRSLFYPGSEFDFDVIKYFIKTSKIDNFYYCDYSIDKQLLLEKLRTYFGKLGFAVALQCQLHPSYYNSKTWEDFWTKEYIENRELLIGDISFINEYKIFNEKTSFKFIYFGTEAIATYKILLQNRILPDLLVIQDHGYGGNWTYFSQDSLLETLSKEYNFYPSYILIDKNQNVWNNYDKISETVGRFGMHQDERVLYKLSK
jgi:hypothetical protein